ncbi:MAG TPA: phosphohistidine phosphatase SixA [Methanoregulaceae archaeon]|nr:phosphohistidine phosphatase SixA [Methanoregulaceae archaeon]
MDVYILRHGKAGQHVPGENDSLRALTEKGREEIKGISEWMVSREIFFDIIATSPLLRATETAKIVAEGLGQEKNLETWSSLTIGGDPGTICRRIADKSEESSLLLVGHEPALSSLISLIISGDTGAGILLAKGGLARIRNVTNNGVGVRGELHWLLTPKQIMSMRSGPDKKDRT